MENCRDCKKRRGRKCAALSALGAWGENCIAWTDDPDWQKKLKKEVEDYREGRYGLNKTLQRPAK